MRQPVIEYTAVARVLVDVLGHHEHMFVFEQDIGERAQFFARIDRAGRAVRRVEDDPTCLRFDGSAQIVGAGSVTNEVIALLVDESRRQRSPSMTLHK
jgi:hypothetical protein